MKNNIELHIKNLSADAISLTGKQLIEKDFNDSLSITHHEQDYEKLDKIEDFRVYLVELEAPLENKLINNIKSLGSDKKIIDLVEYFKANNYPNDAGGFLRLSSIYKYGDIPAPTMLSELIWHLEPNADLTITLSPRDIIYPEFIDIENQKPSQNEFTISPYQVYVVNETNAPKLAKIFGFAKNFNKPNYGSDEGIVITPLQADVSYPQLLSESAFHPFTVGETRIQITENPQQVFLNDIDLMVANANGQSVKVPFSLKELDDIYKDRNQDNMLQLHKKYMIDSRSELSLLLPENEKVVLTFFPLNNEKKEL